MEWNQNHGLFLADFYQMKTFDLKSIDTVQNGMMASAIILMLADGPQCGYKYER